MNENESDRAEVGEEPNPTPNSTPTPPTENTTPPPPTAGPESTNQQNRSTGDIILQVHIANIFLTFCQRYARLCNRNIRRYLEFIVLLKVSLIWPKNVFISEFLGSWSVSCPYLCPCRLSTVRNMFGPTQR